MKKNTLFLMVLMSAVMLFVLAGCGSKTEEAPEIQTEELTVTLAWQEQYDLGMKYLSEGNYEEAIIAFTAAIELEPKQSSAYLGLAEVYIAQNDFEAAKSILEEGIGLVDDFTALQERLDALNKGDVSDFWGNVRKMSNYDANGVLTWYHVYDYANSKRSMVTSYDGAGNQTGQTALLYNDAGNQVQGYFYYDHDGHIEKRTYEYDGLGNMTKSTFFDETGEISWYSTYKFDGSTLLQEVGYDSNGEKLETYTYSYLDDGSKRMDFYSEFDGREYYDLWEYNEAGSIEKYGHYEMDGTPQSYTIYAYDDDGTCISETRYDGDGNITDTTTYN